MSLTNVKPMYFNKYKQSLSNNLRANLFRLAKKETNMSDIIKKFAYL